MKIPSLFCLIIAFLLMACDNDDKPTQVVDFRVAFGSCAKQYKPMPMLDVARSYNPDAFIFLGDNIYGDTYSMDTLKMKYDMLGAKKEFKNLINSTTVYSVWDDHDYGDNDMGRHYPFKKESEQLFLDFWNVHMDSERRSHEGIYGVEYLTKNDKTVQIIMLDTRYFRDDLVKRQRQDTIHKNDYVPNMSPDSTFLGRKQWRWLEEQFVKPADVRIVASSNQFSHEYNGWESWTNVPREQEKMLKLIEKTMANGVVFISGDVHWGEISKMNNDILYPIYDVTSSGITETWPKIEPNKNRIGEVVVQNNIGVIDVHFEGEKSTVNLALVDSTGQRVIKHEFPLSEIEF